MRHQRLFELRFEHAFYSDARCPALRGRATPTSARALAGHHLVAKARPDGLEILAPLGDDGQPFIVLAPGLTLEFVLRVVDGELVQFTDLSPISTLERPLYRNAGAQGGALELGEGSEGDEGLPREVLARVEISGVAASWLDDPPCFVVTLQPRQIRWVYYLVRATDTKIEKVRIDDQDPSRSGARLEFEVESAEGEALLASDRVASDLARRYPDQSRLRLVSQTTLAARASPRRHLALKVAKEVLTGELPNPSLLMSSSIELDGQTHECLYEVLTY